LRLAELAANNFGGDPYSFANNCRNVIRSWSGGVADTVANRLIIWVVEPVIIMEMKSIR